MLFCFLDTPTVGDVCLQFGNRYTRSRGMYFSSLDRGNFSSMVYNWPHNDVQIIVVTDGSRVLGLGDLGANGMGISIGKLALYCAAGGIAPHRVLPVVIDVGTNNQQLLDDPHYIGVRSNRLEGEEYEEVIEEFMRAVFQRWPEALLQFEDFETHKAVPMLEKYRKKYRVFNDDIQGTGCVTLSGLISCARQANTSITKLKVLCAGAGSAGLGVCTQLRDGMVMAGLSKEEATANFVICSDVGAYGTKDGTHNDPHYQASDPRSYITDQQKDWVNDAVSDGMSLLDSIEKFKPDVLLGLSTAPKLFNETIIRAMAKHKQHPIIIPMSNPTSRCECTPEEAYKWSDGRAVVATGSPFPPYHMPDGQIKIPSQCNNMYIFPGLGLGAQLAGVQRITDTMIYAAAIACADAMTPEEIAEGRTFPRLNRIRIVSHAVALAVVEQAYKEEQVTSISESDLKRSGSLSNYISRKMYYPVYVPLVSPTNY